MKSFQVLALLFAYAWLCAPSIAEEKTLANRPLFEDLGFEDLGNELLLPSTNKQPTPSAPPSKPLNETNRLSPVVQHMHTAQTLLQQSNPSDDASFAQSQALTSLDTLIAELTQRQSQCQGGQCAKPSSSKPGNKKPNPSKKTGQSPAKSATPNTNSDADLSTKSPDVSQLVKDLWGQLPQRQRQQILQPLSEEFLPKYATEIEAYFRDLADPASAPTEAP